jgi:transketolase C-terminal domain/subunit
MQEGVIRSYVWVLRSKLLQVEGHSVRCGVSGKASEIVVKLDRRYMQRLCTRSRFGSSRAMVATVQLDRHPRMLLGRSCH